MFFVVRHDSSWSSARELGSYEDGDRLDDIFSSRESKVEFELPGDAYYEVMQHAAQTALVMVVVADWEKGLNYPSLSPYHLHFFVMVRNSTYCTYYELQ